MNYENRSNDIENPAMSCLLLEPNVKDRSNISSDECLQETNVQLLQVRHRRVLLRLAEVKGAILNLLGRLSHVEITGADRKRFRKRFDKLSNEVDQLLARVTSIRLPQQVSHASNTLSNFEFEMDALEARVNEELQKYGDMLTRMAKPEIGCFMNFVFFVCCIELPEED